ncbi:MAG: DNA polymerase I [Clostridiales bacterium]|jgi:DNA polymerase-1|nr:DNA polymerase I [Clostridiales bacterium]
MGDKIILLDGMSLAHRAFYALPPLTTSAGEHVNAVLGFLNTFYKLYEEEQPRWAAVAFDLPAPTFRHRLYAAYKGTREAMPMELRPQIPLLKAVIEALGIPILELEGYEADDILGTLAKRCGEAGLSPMIITGDRDLLQTATDAVCVKIPTTKAGAAVAETYFAKDVIERYGVTPLQFIDVKALWGDASDNIPGVPSIGEKTACKIIARFGSVEEAIANAGTITPKKASENLIAYREQALLSKKMAAIMTDVPIAFDINGIKEPDVYGQAAYEIVKRLEFKSMYAKFQALSKPDEAAPAKEISAGEAVLLLNNASEAAYLILDRDGVFEGFSFAAQGGEYIIKSPFGGLEEERILTALKPFFEGAVKKTAWDAKADAKRLDAYGISLENVDFDVMLSVFLSNVTGAGAAKKESAAELLKTRATLEKTMDGQGITPLFNNIEMPLIRVLRDMERLGVRVDGAELARYGNLLGKRIDGLQADIYNLTGESFNINSPKQLGAVLFERLGLPGGKMTKTGYSTAADVLERLEDKHPAVHAIMEYRQLTKLKSTYANGLLTAMDKTTGRVYTTFTQAVTSTGRLSSAEPNMQNIPVRTELGRELRRAFIPADGCLFIDADYSQIELRVLAHMSGDETFINAFTNSLDIHSITASEVFGAALADVTPAQRRVAKTVNFGIIYGQSAFSLAHDLGITLKEAEDYINGYFRRYPRVKIFMEDTVKNAKRLGYTTTIMGRRREIAELRSPNRNTRMFGERAAMNMPIQGSAADIIKIAMIRTYNRLIAEGLKARIILQVHDELLVEAPEAEAEAAAQLLKAEMEGAAALSVPLKADVSTGRSWYEAKL